MKISTIYLLVSFSILSCMTINSYGAYPFQMNSHYTIQSQNIFRLKQTETYNGVSSRLKLLLTYGEIFPTGLYVAAGSTLSINVSSVTGTHSSYGKLIINQRYNNGAAGTRQSVDLVNGANTITATTSGNIYFSYAATSPDAGRELQFTVNSGHVPMPFFVSGETTNQQWLNMLDNYAVTPDITILGRRGLMVLDRNTINGSYRNSDFKIVAQTFDKIIDAAIDISGIITTSSTTDVNRDFPNLMYVTTNDAGMGTNNPHATGGGIIRVPISWVGNSDYMLINGAWGLAHEVGHHFQQNAWDWGVNTEVQVNIHTIAARKVLYPTGESFGQGHWINAASYLVNSNTGKNYDNIPNFNDRLPIFHQLTLAFGEDFYKRFYKYVRENAINSSATAATEKLNFMRVASIISGKNLTNFFIQWGLNPTSSQQTTLTNLGLPAPVISPATYSSFNMLSNNTLRSDTTVEEGTSVVYEVVAAAANGVKRVEFYDGSTKLGESTNFPFKHTLNLGFGLHSITAKLIDGLDNMLLATPATAVNVTKISITAPNNFASYNVGSQVEISTNVVINGQDPLLKVEFYSNNVKIGESTSSPYGYVISNTQRGLLNIVAKAIYSSGLESTSDNIVVNIGGFYPTADAHVTDGASADNNFGLAPKLTLKSDANVGYTRIVYLKFDLSQLQQNSYTNGKLVLNIHTPNNNVANKTDWQLYAVNDDTWSETTITFDNKPAHSALLATVRAVASGRLEWDITDQLNLEMAGDKVISLVLLSSVKGQTYNIDFASKEFGDPSLMPVLQLSPATGFTTLPISCNNLTAKSIYNGVSLTWNTSSETDSKNYKVWRSVNGVDFKLISTVASKNDKTGAKYQFTDQLVLSGLYFYKITHTDFNGITTDVCEVIATNYNAFIKDEIQVYPNPTSDKLTIISRNHGSVEVILVDVLGKIVYRKWHHSAQPIVLSVAALNSGVYQIILKGKTLSNVKFIKE